MCQRAATSAQPATTYDDERQRANWLAPKSVIKGPWSANFCLLRNVNVSRTRFVACLYWNSLKTRFSCIQKMEFLVKMRLSEVDFLIHECMIHLKSTLPGWNSLAKMDNTSEFAQSGPKSGFSGTRRDTFSLVALVARLFSGIARAQIF